MSPTLRTLKNRVYYRLSTEALAALTLVAASPDPDAVRILCGALGIPGVVHKAAVAALVARGTSVEPRVRRCLDALDEHTVHGASRELSLLANPVSDMAAE